MSQMINFGVLLFAWFCSSLAQASISWSGGSNLDYSRLKDQYSGDIRIRVRIESGVPLTKVRGFDLKIDHIPHALTNRSTEWEIRCFRGKIQLQSSSPYSAPYLLSDPISIRAPAGFIHSGNRAYRDELRIYSVGNQCEVVNVVDLEKYLDGLVNSEISSKWNLESIEAQVVAARTYALHQVQESRGKKESRFDLDATVKDQVYNGSLGESFHSSLAVEKTKGLVLTAGQGKKILPIKAFYHSTCGGLTELPQNVWGKVSAGLKRKIACPYCSSSPRYKWDLELGIEEISQSILSAVKEIGLLPNWPKWAGRVLQQNQLLEVRIRQRDPQGRVSRLSTLWVDGKSVVDLPVTGAQFRDWMGPSRLKSTWFDLSSRFPAPQASRQRAYRFEGRGNGHGVGLCQWGAKTMGEMGFKMSSILKHYYPDAHLTKLW